MWTLTICRFLLARIYLDLLADKLTPNDVRSKLDVFRNKRRRKDEDQKVQVLAYAYGQVIERIRGRCQDSGTLRWRFWHDPHAKRQLTTLELQHALATKKGKSELDHGDLPHIGDMISVCAGLVTVDEESGIIRLVHYTAQEYLEQTLISWYPEAEFAVAKTCIVYLSFAVFEIGYCKTDDAFEERLRSNPFYDYAACNWGHHARDMRAGQEVLEFLKNNAKVEASFQVLMAGGRGWPNYSQRVARNMTGLHLAGYFGVDDAVETLLRGKHNLNQMNSHKRTPLSLAAGERA